MPFVCHYCMPFGISGFGSAYGHNRISFIFFYSATCTKFFWGQTIRIKIGALSMGTFLTVGTLNILNLYLILFSIIIYHTNGPPRHYNKSTAEVVIYNSPTKQLPIIM